MIRFVLIILDLVFGRRFPERFRVRRQARLLSGGLQRHANPMKLPNSSQAAGYSFR